MKNCKLFKGDYPENNMKGKNELGESFLFDTHAHLNFKPLREDIEGVLSRAGNAGVKRIVSIGAGDGIKGNDKSLEIARSHENIWATVGVHPHDAKLSNDKELNRITELARDSKVVAWGEIGLDFHYNHSPHDVQLEVFREQLEIAVEIGLPVIIHDREAHSETMEILRRYFSQKDSASKPIGIMHCFSGDVQMAREMIRLGFLISVPGVVTFRNARRLVEVVEAIPVEKMVLETDCPFLTPEPYRGKTNEPAYVRLVAEKVAQIKGITLEDTARATTSNAMEIFGIESEPKPVFIYTIRGNLYLNITSRCNNRCSFCPKQGSGKVKGHYLLLDREPTAAEVISAIGDPTRYPEVVFVGLGESTLRLETLKEIAAWLKQRGARVRIDTDGQANLVYGRDITPELKGLVDAISVSLNAPDAETYMKMCSPSRGAETYMAILEFLRAAKRHIPEVVATVVDIPGLDVAACRKIAEDIGVGFRVRAYNDPGAP